MSYVHVQNVVDVNDDVSHVGEKVVLSLASLTSEKGVIIARLHEAIERKKTLDDIIKDLTDKVSENNFTSQEVRDTLSSQLENHIYELEIITKKIEEINKELCVIERKMTNFFNSTGNPGLKIPSNR